VRQAEERRGEKRIYLGLFSVSREIICKCTYFEPSVWPAEPFGREDQVSFKLKKLFQEFFGICK